MNDLRDFFIFCSGSNINVLKKTPTEINKHTGIGATIFFTGVFASLAGGYAIYTVFQSYFAAIFFGMIWGAMIFNLDRYIVSTLKMRKSAFRNFVGALPRVALALIIAIVIAKPMELKIFDSEIQAELALMQQENYKEQEDLLSARFEDEVAETNQELLSLKQELSTKEQQRDRLDALAIGEADGTGGSQLRNMGPIYRAKKQDALKAQLELDDLYARLIPQIEEKEDKLLLLDAKQNAELEALNRVELSGFAARIEALDRVSQKSSAIAMASLFIMLLFIAIETTPIFVKLISSRSPYDYVLDKHEHAFVKNHELHTTRLSNEVDNLVNHETRIAAFRTQMAIDTEKRIIKEAVEEKYEALKSQTTLWQRIFGKKSLLDV